MQQFVVDCSAKLIESLPVEIFYKEIYYSAALSGLFKSEEIAVRLRPFEFYDVGNKRKDFIHVFAYLIEGRTMVQKDDLSQRIVTKLQGLFPQVDAISMSIFEIEEASFYKLPSLLRSKP